MGKYYFYFLLTVLCHIIVLDTHCFKNISMRFGPATRTQQKFTLEKFFWESIVKKKIIGNIIPFNK